MSSWLIRVDGLEFNSDDLLIEDVGAIEKASGESWYIANPLVSIAVGRAFLAAAMLRSGRTPDVVEKYLTSMKLGELRRAFTFVPDDEPGGEVEEVDPSGPPPRTTTPSSSPGGPGPTTGPPTSPATNDSVT
jgi:hypothetical protein